MTGGAQQKINTVNVRTDWVLFTCRGAIVGFRSRRAQRAQPVHTAAATLTGHAGRGGAIAQRREASEALSQRGEPSDARGVGCVSAGAECALSGDSRMAGRAGRARGVVVGCVLPIFAGETYTAEACSSGRAFETIETQVI